MVHGFTEGQAFDRLHFLLLEGHMSRRVLIAFLSMFVCGLSITLAPKPALAAGANCDVNTCISICQKRNPQYGAGQGCTTYCLQTIDQRKKSGQCK
jgi:hypothetical protein